jgi:hypothetical protein
MSEMVDPSEIREEFKLRDLKHNKPDSEQRLTNLKKQYGEYEVKEISGKTILDKEKNLYNLSRRIKHKYPNWRPKGSNFLFKTDPDSNDILLHKKVGGKKWVSIDDPKLSSEISDNLGPSTLEIRLYNDAKEIIDYRYPNNKFTTAYPGREDVDVKINDSGKIKVYSPKINKWYNLLNNDEKTQNGHLPNDIKEALGDTAEVITAQNEDFIDEKHKEFIELKINEDSIEENIEYITEAKNLKEDEAALKKSIEDLRSSVTTLDDSDLIDAANLMLETKQNELLKVENQLKEVESRLVERTAMLVENEARFREVGFSDHEIRVALAERIRERDSNRERMNEVTQEREQKLEENEIIEEHKPLRQRIKDVFKKYGFTVTAVVTAVGIVIGVIVSNLKSGLSSVAKGVGNGLKAIGKKLGQILPGMVGAIASFIFKTAGEVVGFLAKNARLLIVAVVLYFVEQYKKKR